MKKSFSNVLGWIFGVGALFYGLKGLLSNSFLESLYLISLGLLVFPPFNDLITKLKYAKVIKGVIGGIFFLSLIISGILSQLKGENQQDKIKRSNFSVLRIVTKEYCTKKGKCASSLDDIFKEGIMGPFESYESVDYSYQQLDGGKDCVISTILSNGKKLAGLCVGENLSNIKYLQGSER